MSKARLILLILATLAGMLAAEGCRSASQTTIVPSQPGQSPAGQNNIAITTPANETAPTVPQEYRQLYNGLSTDIDRFQTKLDLMSSGSAKADKTVFAAELLYANGNVGEALLNPLVMGLNRLMLDRFQSMGIKGVVVAIKYPLLSPDFPRSSEFLKFYKDIIVECHSRDLKVLVEVGAIFSGTPYSPVQIDWSKYTTESFLQGLEDQLILVAGQVQPDYLTLANEPVTDEGLTDLIYLDYQATPHNLRTAELNRLATQASMNSVQKANLSTLGQYLQKLLRDQTPTYPSK